MSARWEYACVTVRGRAPWGFQLRQSDTETQRSVQVHQVEEGSHASLAGLCEDDELVSVNEVQCAELSLAEVTVLIENATDCLQLLVKRCCLPPQESCHSVSTTLQISSPLRSHGLQEPYSFESQNEAHCGETGSDGNGGTIVRTQFCIPAKDRCKPNTQDSDVGGPRLEVTQGSVVQLQLSLAQTTLDDTGCASLGSAHGVEGDFNKQPKNEDDKSITSAPACSFFIPRHEREPLGQRGVLVSSPSALLGQVDIAIQSSGRGSGTEKVGACETEAKASERLDYAEGEGGHTDEAHTSFTVSFGIPSEEGDSESERELDQPNKHRAKHARLRRSESLSEKQVKEAKSKCKRIALLLSAAASNPNNKGLLMFKKHKQRAKQYTLVSYGTGEDEPQQSEDEEDEDNKERHTVEITVLAASETELDEDFLNSTGRKSIVTFDWDTGLLDIERKLHNKEDMNALPETRGKGALMFAQRRQRMDEIAAQHEEMRNKGIPVESMQEADKQFQHVDQHTSIQANQNYMDVNVQQQQHQQYQQYQEQYYHQQQQQQQQQYQEYQQQMQYQQQNYQHQQEYQQEQQYHQHHQYQQQHELQQYSHHMNGMQTHPTNVMQSSVINRSAKPFSVQNKTPAPFSSSENQAQPLYLVGQGEQIASRDERISVPAIKTGILQNTRRQNKAKPMFTFKEPPKVSPNPELLSLLHRNDKKVGFDSGPEEDYLSLGAEACNFLQSPKVKDKIPPPVAPKPHINSASPPWSPEPGVPSQPFSQQTENNVPEAPKDSVPQMESSAMPQQECSHPPAPEQQEVHANPSSQAQSEAVNAWGISDPQIQLDQQQNTWQVNQSKPQQPAKSDTPVSSLGPPPTQTNEQSQAPAETQSQIQPLWVTQCQVQPQTSIHTQSQSQPSWISQSQPQHQAQPQSQMNTWTTAPTHSTPQPPWSHSQVSGQPSVSTWPQDANQTQVQQPWTQQQQESQPLTHWTAPQQHPQPSPWIQGQPQSQPPWMAQSQQQALQQPPVNAWNQSQSPVQAQPLWTQQAQPSPQPTTAPQMQQCQDTWSSVPTQSQPQWPQQPQQHPQQTMNSWAPEQTQAQPPWTPPPNQTQPPWSQKQMPSQSQPQSISSVWAPRPQQGPVSNTAAAESQNLSQSSKTWSPHQTSQPAAPQRMNSYTPRPKVPSSMPTSSTMSRCGMGSAFEMPALRGKGAELFAKRQSRMERYVVDSDTVQANQARSSSPSPSLPASWKYSPNCRAPPPLAYNPLQSPSYPLGAVKQPPSSSPALKNKNTPKEKEKPALKPLNALDVMKHQPYQLNASLFTYGPAVEKLEAEKEAAEKLAAQKADEVQSQAQAQIAVGHPNQNQDMRYEQATYGFTPQQSQSLQQPYAINVPSHATHDGSYHHIYQPDPNSYQQVPYQEMYNPQHAYQQHPSSPYQQPSSLSYQQPSVYQVSPNAPFPTSLSPSHHSAPPSYVAPTFAVAPRADSASGSSIHTAPKPKFSAKKSDAQVWKPSPVESVDK